MYIITSDRVALRPLNRHDVDELVRIVGQQRIADSIIKTPHPSTDEVAETWLEVHERELKSGQGYHFAITPIGDADRLMGYVALNDIVIENKEAQISFWIGEDYSRQGFVTEAARALVVFAFTTLSLNRISAFHKTQNVSAGRVIEKLGMKKEGVLRQHFYKHGVFYDVCVSSILHQEYLIDQDYSENTAVVESMRAPFAG